MSYQLGKKEKTFYFLLFFFFVGLYMPGIDWLYNVAMWLFFVYSFFFNPFTEKWKLLRQRKEVLLILLFLILNAVSALLSGNQKEGISYLGIRISLFVIPLALGSVYIKEHLKDRLIFCFATVTSVAAFGCLGWGIFQASRHHDWSLLYNDNLSEIINFQSIYFAMVVNLTIFSFIYLVTKKSVLINNNIIVPLLLVLLVIHFLLASRMAILILYSTTFIFAVVQIIRKKKYLEGVTLIMGLLLACFLLVKFFPKTINRFKELTYTKFDYHSTARESHFNVALDSTQWNGANLRIAVWQCAWSVINDHKILGTGLGDKMDELKKEYAKRGFIFGIQTNRNTHNNYIDIWLSLGLIGLVLFILGAAVLPIYRCIRACDWYGMIIILSFLISLFSENYMDRTMGNTLLGFFLAFITSYKHPGKQTPIDYPSDTFE